MELARIPIIYAFVLLLFATGCGGNSDFTEVTGTITLDGAPLTGVLVEFTPEAKSAPSYGETDAEGKYFLRCTRTQRGAKLGSYKVRIMDQDPEEDENGMMPKMIRKVPKKYRENSNLVFEVSSGKNVADFDLTSL